MSPPQTEASERRASDSSSVAAGTRARPDEGWPLHLEPAVALLREPPRTWLAWRPTSLPWESARWVWPGAVPTPPVLHAARAEAAERALLWHTFGRGAPVELLVGEGLALRVREDYQRQRLWDERVHGAWLPLLERPVLAWQDPATGWLIEPRGRHHLVLGHGSRLREEPSTRPWEDTLLPAGVWLRFRSRESARLAQVVRLWWLAYQSDEPPGSVAGLLAFLSETSVLTVDLTPDSEEGATWRLEAVLPEQRGGEALVQALQQAVDGLGLPGAFELHWRAPVLVVTTTMTRRELHGLALVITLWRAEAEAGTLGR